MNFLSHNVFDYKWMLNVWIDEERMCLKFYEDCILGYKLNGRIVINLCLNLNELIYSCSWKLVIIDYLHTVGSPLARYRIAVWLVNMTVGLIFQIVGSPFILDVGSPFRSRGFFSSSWCRRAVYFTYRFAA